MSADDCPPPLKLEAFAAGGLAPDERARIAAHLRVCPRCQPPATERLEPSGSPAPPAPAPPESEPASFPPRPGQAVGRYLILEPIGSGGAGTVFAAYDKALDRRVALKFLNLPAPGALDQLLEEASLMAKLQHPNVVTVYDVGQLGQMRFIAMELVEGQNLAHWRAAEPRAQSEILRVMAGAARGLAAAHAAGVVHRDVKPHNILVSGARVLVTDFGISLRAHEPAESTIAGTPAYMPPEQYAGEPADRRCDVFSFCATLYELLYGQRPFRAGTVTEVRDRIQRGQVEPPPPGAKVPLRLQRLILSGLAVDPATRPADLDRIADELLRDPRRPARRLQAAGAALALVLVAFVGGGHLRRAPERQCRAGAGTIDATWGAPTRARLQAHFARIGEPAVWTATERVLDRYVQRWRAMVQQACTATYVERRQSSELLDVRLQCLQSRRTALAAVVAAFEGAGAGAPRAVLLDGPTAASRLPPVAECEVSGQIQLLPADPAARASLAEVEQLIAGAFAGGLRGDLEGARAGVEAAVKQARALGYQPVLARALTQAARLEQQAGRRGGDGDALARAARLLEEAATVAERGRADLRRAIALRELMMVSLQRGEPRAAELYSQLASAAIDRLGDPADERAAFLLNEGWRKRTFALGDGVAEFRRSLELRRKVLPETDPDLVPSLIAVCLEERGEAARSCHRRALDTAQQALGPAHPYVGHIYANLAAALRRDPDTRAEACDLLRKAAAVYEASGDREKASTLATRTDLASCLREAGDAPAARTVYEQLLAAEPASSPQRAHLHQSYGRFLAGLGDRESGVRHLKEALTAGRQLAGACDDTVIDTLVDLTAAQRAGGRLAEAIDELTLTATACERAGSHPLHLPTLHETLGTTLLAAGRPAAAIDPLTRALDLRIEGGASPSSLADTELVLATVLLTQPQPSRADRGRGCTLARQALSNGALRVRPRWVVQHCPGSASWLRPESRQVPAGAR